MNHIFVVLALFGMIGAWIILPLVPTLREFFHKTDNQPFQIMQENPFNPMHFAEVFAKRLDEVRNEIEARRICGGSAWGHFDDREAYQIIGRPEEIPAASAENNSILIICSSGSLLDRIQFCKEVYAAGDLAGGSGATFSAVLCEGALDLGQETSVSHWAHSRSHLNVGENSILRGRVTSEGTIRLGRGTTFERVHARRVDFGREAGSVRTMGPSFVSRRKISQNGGLAIKRRIVPGDLEISADRVWTSDLIVKGKLVVNAGSLVDGNLKSYEDMRIGPGAVIVGSIVSAQNIELAENCAVLGPVISEGAAFLRSGCHIGTEQLPATVTATSLEVGRGAVVFGTVWARKSGHVYD